MNVMNTRARARGRRKSNGLTSFIKVPETKYSQRDRQLGVREGLAYIPASPQSSMKASRIFHFWSVSLVLEGVGDAFHLHLFSLPPTSSVCVGVVMAAE